jgi:ribosomal-protein-alanine N-acetyltransferase
MEIISIDTPRLFIRNLRPSDLDNFYQYRSNPEITKYQGFGVMTMQQAEAFIEEQKNKVFGNPGEWVQFGIEEKTKKTLIGDCAMKLQADDPRIAEIGITISHSEQKKGFAKEVLHGLVSFLFTSMNIHRIVETVDAENEASIQLLRSAGFRQEGHFIENIFFKGKWGSEYQFAMLRKEWERKYEI